MRSSADLLTRVLYLLIPPLLYLCGEVAVAGAQSEVSGRPTEAGGGASSEEVITVEVPEQEEEFDSTVFDLYVGDDFQGAVVASYTDDWFEIEDPGDALAQYSVLQTNQVSKGKLTELFSGRIPKMRSVEGLGTILYDLRTFRIVFQPDPSLLEAKSLDWKRRVGSPEPGLSAQQTVGLVVSQDTASSTLGSSTAFTHRGLLSYEDTFLRTNGFLTQDDGYQLNEATLGRIIDDYDARAGFLQMRSQAFTPSLRFVGVQFETAQNIFLDNDQARGSKMEIFVPSRSTVQFYRDSQLLSVQLLDFGLQEVDTSAFPQGSYDVDIIITDSSGRETRDKRFFTKAGFLASRATPIVFFSGGAVRNLMEVLSTPIAQGGVRVRASDFFDVGVGLAATDQNSIGNADINGFYDVFRLGLGTAVSSGGDFARQGSVSFTLFDFSISGRLVHADGEPTAAGVATPIPDNVGFLPQLATVPVNLVIQTQRSKGLSISRQVGPLTMRYNIQDNRIGEGTANNYAKGPTVDYRIYDDTNSSVVLRGAYFDTEYGANSSVQLFYRYRISPQLNFNSQLMRRWQRDQEELLLLTGLNYSSQTFSSSSGSRIQVLEEARRTEQSAEKTDTLTSTVQGNVQADYLTLGTFVRDTRSRDGDSTTLLGVNAESTVYVSNKGDIDLSTPPKNEAVFVAEVRGNLLSDSDRFDVIVNGQRQGVISGNTRALISLTPYQEYTISISAQEGSSLVDYDAARYKVTLFPGNVAKRVWQVDKVFVLLGRLVDESGEPIERERIRGAKGYGFTEADGTFQIEVSGGETLSIESPRHKCTLQWSTKEIPDYIMDAGDVVCRAGIPEGKTETQ